MAFTLTLEVATSIELSIARGLTATLCSFPESLCFWLDCDLLDSV